MIDKNLKTSPISMLEYISILNNEEKPSCLSNYKIFFSEKLNTDFIESNYGNQMISFIEPNAKKKDVKPMVLKKHFPSTEEVTLFNKMFKNK